MTSDSLFIPDIWKAKMAEQAERYDEMAEIMAKYVSEKKEPLSVDERNLLSVAYKNSVGTRRSALRVISAMLGKSTVKDQMRTLGEEYRNSIAEELINICKDIIQLIEENLVQNVNSDEEKVFYNKMVGDYYRYLCEFNGDGGHSEKAKEAYSRATQAAENLPATNPVRLGLALNFSVFYFEIANIPEEACRIAKSAFDAAISQLESVEDNNYRDSTLIMQLLRDNLTLWTSETGENN